MTAWQRYLEGDTGRWLFRAERLRHRDGRSLVDALARDPWEREIFEPIDAEGTRLAYIDAIRGVGKTTLAAAVAVERTVLRRDHDVFVLANDRDQAAILLREAVGFVQRDPVLTRILTPRASAIENPATGSRLEVLASDAVSNYGYGARSFTAIFDEFWGQTNRDLFDAFWTAVPKTPGSQVIILTNAGPARDGVAWEVRELCRTSNDPALRFWAAAERGVMPSWIDPAEVERQRRTTPPSVFGRLWKGEWGHGGGDFLTREDVEACIDEKLNAHRLEFARGRRHYVGIDLGLKHDRSVVVVVHKEREVTVVDHVETWSGTPERPVSLEDVQAHLSMLTRKVPRIARGYADPWQGALLIERAKRGGMRHLEELTFTPANLQTLSQALWNAFRSRLIRIPPHALLVDELVTLRIVERRYGWRIDHQSGGFSDHAMALGLALVAAIPESGEAVVDDPRWDEEIARYLECIQDRRPFGFKKRNGLTLVDFMPGCGVAPRPENFEACIRLAQILRKADRISVQEFEELRRHYRERVRREVRFSSDVFGAIDDGWRDRELGSIHHFVFGRERWEAPRTAETHQENRT